MTNLLMGILTLRYSFLPLILLSLLACAGLGEGATLSGVRFGSHQGFDRLVCELSEQVNYSLSQKSADHIEVRLHSVDVDDRFFLPKLTPQIKLISSVEAFREGDQDIILEIRGNVPVEARPIELKGEHWRLAFDISAVEAESQKPPSQVKSPATETPRTQTPAKPQKKNEYVPGDKPMETRYADKGQVDSTLKKPKESSVESSDSKSGLLGQGVDSSDVKSLTDVTGSSTESLDTAKVFEVLAEFFYLAGDRQTAREFAQLYVDHLKQSDATSEVGQVPSQRALPIWLISLIAFVAGLAGGVLGNRLRLMKLPYNLKHRPEEASDAATELAEDIDALDRAVASEHPLGTTKQSVPESMTHGANQEVAEEEQPASVEAAMKESLMDRRVKRVLELSGQNRSLAEIAQELDMGQDEVKLIIDLNS